MEPRRLLAVDPIRVGAVYFEEATSQDEAGDLVEITWLGGAPGTRLTGLVIDTDKFADGLTMGDAFFDTQPGGGGVFGSSGLTILQRDGIDSVDAVLADGGTTLRFTFAGFDVGEKLVFSVDVDEQGFEDASAVVEGNEFGGSRLTVTFAADHFEEAKATDVLFSDDYQDDWAASKLKLPPDNYMPPSDVPRPVHTAGAFASLIQTPLPITIAGTVFEDVDLDNVQEPGEPGLEQVELTLFRLEGGQYVTTGQTVLTDASGNYLFEKVLPGTYRIVETQPAGYFSVGASAGSVGGVPRGKVTGVNAISGIELLGGEDSVENDFAEARPAALSGNVYHDADNDGQLDSGELGIGNVLISVEYLPPIGSAPAPIDVYTLPDGSWSVKGLMPGDYRVEEFQPGGYLDGLDAAGTAGGAAHNPGDLIDGIRLDSGASGRQYNFGELVPSSISGRVIADRNANGQYDLGEKLLAGVTVHLLDASGHVINTTQTDAFGQYEFTGLAPGVYGVREVQPAGYYDGADHVGTAGGKLVPPDSIVAITLASGTAAVGYDFCEILPSSIGGRVFVDADDNGIYDQGEKLLSRVTIHLLDNSGARTATTETDAAGEYLFTGLAPGLYGVEEVQPAAYFDGSDHVGSEGGQLVPPDSIVGIRLISGTEAVHYDFGELEPASLSGYVYVDDNNNATRDAGEAAIANVELMLLNAQGDPTGVTATTDASGYYRFDHLKPRETYGVQEAQPEGYYDGLDSPGTAGGIAHNPGDSITGVFLRPGTDAEQYNFGELRPASISGRVHAELILNGTPDPGEPLLAGVTIYLLDGWGNRIASTTTDENGEYIFQNLAPGTYGVEEIQPGGYFDGQDYVGSAGGTLDANDRIMGAKLISGFQAVEYNFCEVVPASVSGYVFQDGDTIRVEPFDDPPDPAAVRDGRFTPDDTPIPGVVLRLGTMTGEPVLDASGRPRIAVTDQSGFYQFTKLEPGIYTIFEVHPQGYVDGIDTPGSHGGVAVNSHEPLSPLLGQLRVDPRNDAILGIQLNPGDVAGSYNFSEVLVVKMPYVIPPPPPPPPPAPPPEAPPIPLPSPAPVARYFPAPGMVLLPEFDWGFEGPFVAYTWHLSVVNGGRPRRESDGTTGAAHVNTPYFNPVSWTGADMSESEWMLANEEGETVAQFQFGPEGGIPLTGDFDGDGMAEVAIFLNGVWFIDLNGNSVWDDGDLWIRLGKEGDLPVTGDWDGDGKTDVGIFGPAWAGDNRAIAAEPGLPDAANQPSSRPKNLPPRPDEATVGWRTLKRTAQGEFRTDLIDHVFQYGLSGDVPIAGDWNGDGVTNIGLFREGTWYLDADGNGQWSAADQYVEQLGRPGDRPVVGDFNGDGIDDLGVYRDGTWYLDTDGDRALTAHDRVFELGGPNDTPVVGDFDGDGTDEVGIYRDGAARPDQQAHEPTEASPADVAVGQ